MCHSQKYTWGEEGKYDDDASSYFKLPRTGIYIFLYWGQHCWIQPIYQPTMKKKDMKMAAFYCLDFGYLKCRF